MDSRSQSEYKPDLTPCIVCEKAVMYLWTDEQSPKATNLDGASDVRIVAWYGSMFDCNEYSAIICDECLDKMIQSRQVKFIREHSPFGD